MVECECNSLDSTVITTVVLIDTWWNVNAKYYTFDIDKPLVLIDTWWNVNEER